MRSSMAAMVLALATMVAGAGVWAVGGNDQDPANKINAKTAICQREVSKRSAIYVQKRAQAIGDCLNAIIKCDEQATAEKAITCRAKLTKENIGKCAVGKLDSGVTTIGAGASQMVSVNGSKAKLDVELRKLRAAIQKKCFVPGVDLEGIDTGLAFPTGTSATTDALVDHVNRDPGGLGCLANGVAAQSAANYVGVLDQIDLLHNRCVIAANPADLGKSCLGDSECGTGGQCAKVATVLLEGGIAGILDCLN